MHNVFVLGNLSDIQIKKNTYERTLSKAPYKYKFLFPPESESYESVNSRPSLPAHAVLG